MILEAFGGKAIAEGVDPSAMLQKCVGKECALLTYPQVDKRDGKTYLHTHFYGLIKGHRAVKPFAAYGELFTEDVAPKSNSKVNPSQDTLPGGWN
jgi:hypothetical protein